MGFKACNCNTYKPIYEMDNPVGNKKKNNLQLDIEKRKDQNSKPRTNTKKKKLK